MENTKPTASAPKRRGRPPKAVKTEPRCDEPITLQGAIVKYAESQHNLRISLYKCGVSYGRMMEKRNRGLVAMGFWVAMLMSFLVVVLGWWPWLKWLFSLLWVAEFVVLDFTIDKQIKKHIDAEVERLKELKEAELKEWEDV